MSFGPFLFLFCAVGLLCFIILLPIEETIAVSLQDTSRRHQSGEELRPRPQETDF